MNGAPPLHLLCLTPAGPPVAAGPDRRLTLAADLPEALQRLAEDPPAAVLADPAAFDRPLPHGVARLAEAAPEAAVILLYTEESEAAALAALPFGAADCLPAGATDDIAGAAAAAAERHRAGRRLTARMRAAGVTETARNTWLWEADAGLRLTWVSEGFRRQCGIDPAAVLGKPPWELDALDQAAEGWQRVRDDVAAGRPLHDVLCSLRDTDGRLHAFRLRGGPAGGGYAGTGSDATHEVEHTVRLAKAHERLMDTHADLQAFRSRVADDLKAARQMQRELLPAPERMAEIEARYGVTLDSHFETSSELGGDIFGLQPIDDHRFALWMADFSGHGVSAALNTFRLHTVIENMTEDMDRPGPYLTRLNARLAGLLPTGQYATVFYGVVDLPSEHLHYAAAAAPAPLLADTATGDVVAADGSGLPLGVSGKAAYETRRMPLPAGTWLLLYSDALIECGRETGADLGKDGVRDLLAAAVADQGAGLTLERLLRPFFDSVPRPLSDDLTALACLRRA